MYLVFLIIGLVTYTHSLFSLEYGFFGKHEGSKPIKNVSVISERHSGSHFVEQLFVANSDLLPKSFIVRHYPPWFMLSKDEYLGNPRHYSFEDTDHFLYIVLFRNPYDWVRAMNVRAFHASDELRKKPFSRFIRTPWKLREASSSDQVFQIGKVRKFFPKVDLNPIDGSQFDNVLKLRTAKIQNMLMIKSRVSNVYYVNYEQFRDHPEEVLAEISDLFQITLKSEFTPITTYQGGAPTKKRYVPKKYVPISSRDLRYINSQLDEEVEKSIGYQLIDIPDEIH